MNLAISTCILFVYLYTTIGANFRLFFKRFSILMIILLNLIETQYIVLYGFFSLVKMTSWDMATI